MWQTRVTLHVRSKSLFTTPFSPVQRIWRGLLTAFPAPVAEALPTRIQAFRSFEGVREFSSGAWLLPCHTETTCSFGEIWDTCCCRDQQRKIQFSDAETCAAAAITVEASLVLGSFYTNERFNFNGKLKMLSGLSLQADDRADDQY